MFIRNYFSSQEPKDYTLATAPEDSSLGTTFASTEDSLGTTAPANYSITHQELRRGQPYLKELQAKGTARAAALATLVATVGTVTFTFLFLGRVSPI